MGSPALLWDEMTDVTKSEGLDQGEKSCGVRLYLIQSLMQKRP